MVDSRFQRFVLSSSYLSAVFLPGLCSAIVDSETVSPFNTFLCYLVTVFYHSSRKVRQISQETQETGSKSEKQGVQSSQPLKQESLSIIP